MHKDSKNKPLDVLIIGMGLSGVCSAIKLIEKNITNIEIHEKSHGIGGTWHDNTYPGAACDVPSHLYCFTFEPNPNWSRRYAKQGEIKKYIEHCVEKYNIGHHARYNSKVTHIHLDEQSGLWKVKFSDGRHVFTHHVIHGGGGIHKPNIPSFEGLDEFEGAVMHTARWDHDVSLTDKTISIIGSAASAIQIIPEVARIAKEVKVFHRTPNYIIPRGDRAYTNKEKNLFKRFPWILKLYRWFFYIRLELVTFPIIKKNSYIGKRAAKKIVQYIRKNIKDKSLHSAFEPEYDLGCKRILLSDDLFHAINQDNVKVITSPIKRFESDCIITNDQQTHKANVVIMATGFDIKGHLYSIDVEGLNSKRLEQTWKNDAEAYRGCCVSGFPNFYMVTGPNTGAGTISLVHIIEQEVNYIVKLIEMAGMAAHINVKQQSQDEYNIKIQKKLNNRVWSAGGCNSWYLSDTGKNITLYPDNARSFKKQLKEIIKGDFYLQKKIQQ